MNTSDSGSISLSNSKKPAFCWKISK